MKLRAALASLAMLGALVIGTAPAAAGPRVPAAEARPGAGSYADTFSSTKRLHPRFPADFPIPRAR